MKINTIKIGKKFEREAFEILKRRFDIVEWSAEELQ